MNVCTLLILFEELHLFHLEGIQFINVKPDIMLLVTAMNH